MKKRTLDDISSNVVINDGKKLKAIVHDNHVYNARGKNSSKSSKAVGVWQQDKQLVHITTMRGNFWKISGFTSDQHDYLHPEEALYLCEKKQLVVHLSDGAVCAIPQLYNLVMQDVSLPCYQAYIRLKVDILGVIMYYIT